MLRYTEEFDVAHIVNDTAPTNAVPDEQDILTVDDKPKAEINQRGEAHHESDSIASLQGEMTKCRINPNLSTTQKQQLWQVLAKHAEVFREGKKWKYNAETVHEIVTGSAKPIRQQFYRVTPEKQKIIDTEVEKLREAGIIEPASGPWSSPVVLVKKPGGAWRLCVDFRKLRRIGAGKAGAPL